MKKTGFKLQNKIWIDKERFILTSKQLLYIYSLISFEPFTLRIMVHILDGILRTHEGKPFFCEKKNEL